MLKHPVIALVFLAVSAHAAAPDCTIRRDTYGVPHIFGATDADVVFGYGYAQDAIGRAAEINGEQDVAFDVAVRAFEIEKLAKSDYAKAPVGARLSAGRLICTAKPESSLGGEHGGSIVVQSSQPRLRCLHLRASKDLVAESAIPISTAHT